MRHIPSLRAIQTFEAAARLGSFLRASDELNVTPSAVSHQIRALEGELGVTLFHRINRSVMLTDVGRRYSEEIAEAFGQIEAASRNIARQGKSDILTVHTVPSFGSQWLMPRIARFGAQNPDIYVRLNASGEAADLSTEAVDIDIRYGEPLASAGLVIEPFPDETIVVLCAPSLANGRNGIRQPEDIRHHTLIHSENNLYRWKDWARDHDVTLDLDPGPRFDRSFMAISAAIDGLGICLESKLLIERELESGQLILPFGPKGPKMGCHSLVYRRSRNRIPKISAFLKWINQALHESLE